MSHVAAASTPSPPATIKVLIAPDGLKPRASISTPDELRTGPGVAASTLIDGGMPAEAGRDFEHRNRTGGVQQLEIGKDENADHDVRPCPEMREIWHFGQKAIMAG